MAQKTSSSVGFPVGLLCLLLASLASAGANEPIALAASEWTVRSEIAATPRFDAFVALLRKLGRKPVPIASLSDALDPFYGASQSAGAIVALDQRNSHHELSLAVGVFLRGQASDPVFPRLEVYSFAGVRPEWTWRANEVSGVRDAPGLFVSAAAQLGTEFTGVQNGSDLVDPLRLARGRLLAVELEGSLQTYLWAQDEKRVETRATGYAAAGQHQSARHSEGLAERAEWRLALAARAELRAAWNAKAPSLCIFWDQEGSGACDLPARNTLERPYRWSFWAGPRGMQAVGGALIWRSKTWRVVVGQASQAWQASLTWQTPRWEISAYTLGLSAGVHWREMWSRSYGARVAHTF